MADDDDDAQKTEDPTRKRLDEAAERGQSPNSRETTSFFMLFTFTLVIISLLPGIIRKVHYTLAIFIERPDTLEADNGSLAILMLNSVYMMMTNLFLPLLAFLVAIIAANLAQNRLIFSFEPLVPKLEKISIFKGIERLFSTRSLAEFLKGVVKILFVGAIAYYAILPYMPHLKQLPDIDIFGMLNFLSSSTKRMLLGICIVMFFLAALDYMYQRYEFIKSLRMSKQEIKDEYRQQEGDPKIKQRIRQIRVERSRKRMMAAVPSADVIITNPTHYSVALKYDGEKMKSPQVVAKGKDLIALKIREVARANNIPLVENPPLAQALFTIDIDSEIPIEHYKAVAEVISYVYRLKGKFKK